MSFTDNAAVLILNNLSISFYRNQKRIVTSLISNFQIQS